MSMIKPAGSSMKKSFHLSEKNVTMKKINPQLAQQVVDNLPVEFAVYDINNCYTFVNELYISDPELRKELIGKDDDFLFGKLGIRTECLDNRKRYFREALTEQKRIGFTEKLNYKYENKTKYYKCYFQPLFTKNKLSGMCLYGNDLTAVILGQKELKYLAYHDRVTELENREAFNNQLDQILYEIPRSNDETHIALLFCNIDGFKTINETMGIDTGDRILREVGQRIKSRLRKSDRIFRYGGDEFIVISKYLTCETDATKIATKIIECIGEPYQIDGKNVDYISVSIGIGILPRDGKDRDTIIKNADFAMNHAKKDGTSQYKFFSEPL